MAFISLVDVWALLTDVDAARAQLGGDMVVLGYHKHGCSLSRSEDNVSQRGVH